MNNSALFKAGKTLIVKVCALSCQKATPFHSGPSTPGNKVMLCKQLGAKGWAGIIQSLIQVHFSLQYCLHQIFFS